MRRSLQVSWKSGLAALAVLAGVGAVAQADPIPGNFWPNPTLEDASGTQIDSPAPWRRGGGDFGDPESPEFCFWDNVGGTVSGSKALRINDLAADGNGEWFVPSFDADRSPVPLPATGGNFLRLHFHRAYDTLGDMRLTIRGDDGVLPAQGGFGRGLGPNYDFVVNGISNGGAGGFESVDVAVPIPTVDGDGNAFTMVGMYINIASGGGGDVLGTLVIDDIYVARVPEPASASLLIGAAGLLLRRRARA